MNNQPATTEHNNLTAAKHNFMSNLFNMFGLRSHSDFSLPEPKIEVAEKISSNGYLTISGEKRHEDAAASKDGYFSEIAYGSFSRTVPLPWDLEYAKASADYTNGVLCVTIPKTKTEQASRQKINLNSEKKAKRKTTAKAKKA